MKKISRIHKAWTRYMPEFNLEKVLLYEWAKNIARGEIKRFPTPKQTIRRLKGICKNRANKNVFRYCKGSHEMFQMSEESVSELNFDLKCQHFTSEIFI